MEANLDSDPVEQDSGACVCQGRPSLDVLKDVQRAYEERIELINKTGGKNKMQKELELLRSWVGDLVEQNGLLARAVEEMEAEVSSRVVFERRRNIEWDEKKNICDQVNELKVLNDSLKKENIAKEREIRKLSNDVQHRDLTIASMRHETTFNRSLPTKDEAVMTEASSPMNECAAVVLAHENPEGIGHHHDVKLKPSDENIRAIRKENVDLREEVRAMSQLCAALYEQRLAASLRLQFKDDIIREMRRQLRMAKAKLEVTKSLGGDQEGEGTRRSRRMRRRDGPDDWGSRNQDPSPDDSVSIHFD